MAVHTKDIKKDMRTNVGYVLPRPVRCPPNPVFLDGSRRTSYKFTRDIGVACTRVLLDVLLVFINIINNIQTRRTNVPPKNLNATICPSWTQVTAWKL